MFYDSVSLQENVVLRDLDFKIDEKIDTDNYYRSKEEKWIRGFHFILSLYPELDKLKDIYCVYKHNKRLNILNINFLNLDLKKYFEDCKKSESKTKNKIWKIPYKKELKKLNNNLIKLFQNIDNLQNIKILNCNSLDFSVFNQIDINPNIKELYLNNDKIKDLNVFCKMFEKNTLELLDLWDNEIEDLNPLCKILETNTSIKTLELGKNYIEDIEPLLKVLEVNQGLQELYIKYNHIKSYTQIEQLKSITEKKHIKLFI